jgi:hypothetical protein
VSSIKRRSRLILLLASLGIFKTRIGVALLYTLVISVKALELREGGVNKAVKEVVNNILKRAEQIAIKSKAL